MPWHLQHVSPLGNLPPVLDGGFDGKFRQRPVGFLSAPDPLAEDNNSAADQGTKKAVNGWVELWHGLSGSIGFAVGYIVMTLFYILRPRAWPNIADHSQIVRFVSSFIFNGFAGIIRAGASMGVGLRS
jgi:hypothetical protein